MNGLNDCAERHCAPTAVKPASPVEEANLRRRRKRRRCTLPERRGLVQLSDQVPEAGGIGCRVFR